MIETAIIGCGRIAWKLEQDPKRQKPCTHAGALQMIPDFRITSACDINATNLEEFARQFPLKEAQLYPDVKKLLKNNHPDLLIIATWTESHYKILSTAITAKIPVIVCEKPVTMTLAQTKKIISQLHTSPSRILVNHERRYSPRYRSLFRMIEGKKIGTIRSINGYVYSNSGKNSAKTLERSNKHGGILLHDGTHLIDLVTRILPRITQVRAWGEFHETPISGTEKWITANLMDENGVSVHLEFSGIMDYFHFELDIWGSHGRFTIGNGYEKLYLAQDSPYYQGFHSLMQDQNYRTNHNLAPFLALYQEVQAFFHSGKGKKFIFQSELKHAYPGMVLMDAIYKSASQKGRTIQL